MAPLLKDNVNRSVIDLLTEEFTAVHSTFPSEEFTVDVMAELNDLELKDRISLIADKLAVHLPAEFPTALDIVTTVADTERVAEWAAWPLCSFVERHGVDHPEASLAAMPALTKRWSCEFAIRPFLDQHLALTTAHLKAWAIDEDESVRRLASEGTRPRLPWGTKVQALIDDPLLGIELLTTLRHDSSETVRRSVANHLNDVARADPALVISTLEVWTGEQPPVNQRMVKHALRTLVKQGDVGSLGLLGFTTDPAIEVSDFSCSPEFINLGTNIELSAELASTADGPQTLAVDFIVHHVSASGTTSPKVFKWTTVTLKSGETVQLSKRRRIQNASTRTYHAGLHRVELQVAGQRLAESAFTLELS